MFIIVALLRTCYNVCYFLLTSEDFYVLRCLYSCGLPNSACVSFCLACLLSKDVILNPCCLAAARLRERLLKHPVINFLNLCLFTYGASTHDTYFVHGKSLWNLQIVLVAMSLMNILNLSFPYVNSSLRSTSSCFVSFKIRLEIERTFET